MNYARPALLAWSSQYRHLREVTRDDVLAVLGELHGARRSSTLVALRSLFASCRKRKTIFRSPVQGIRVGERVQGVIQPLSQDEVDQAAEAATTPAARLVLVLAAMHAARWPSTANPHLIVNQHSANGTEPVSTSSPPLRPTTSHGTNEIRVRAQIGG